MPKTKAILRIHCPDQKGLVFAISKFIFEHSGNITYLDQYTDPDLQAFFVRIEWELEEFSLSKEQIAAEFAQQIAVLHQMHFELDFSDQSPRVAIFVSKESHCLFDILARCSSGEFQIQVPLILSNHLDLKPLADKFQIPFLHFPVEEQTQAVQEEAMLQALVEAKVDLVILARYMRIIGSKLIEPFRNRIINIHHSMLPAFAGGRPYHAALERGVKMIGATSHYVTEALDQGPIIEQETVHVKYNEKLQDLIRKGKDLEKIVLSRAIWNHLQRKMMVVGNKTVIFK
ncbi:MAG: formyltetrahydrofolate deformylase [Candidatus Lambdaproteobacteria bacterium RIFOXYD1_FULL_56_27]|uniref:Formyltetrahydrofolate deformylase n=1 Tax=Candidatus Lambdaproteobacteria bacterium RIFOXYD2_FULL_56_26 TaxID=1817773 RepID=A0A1F6GTK1_9PROT|nr:MAG: formyltetrahydrofolate deformylase [Candidatus Lambdaproteobacteria bacterium RIFOXYC1_FULL_56_13]OGH01414.1 MAG: formyltetrahydrofolate deformylase [Candidatus Lambdaproteobacteria bacterium RIFOXYD2_FULL_56_26]OGH06510.1 MAG: formyltetrahydrofolate deformylase [Candidatus Lambdaproteobacteria bacterium RIFOXYD1_FULL_56_27]